MAMVLLRLAVLLHDESLRSSAVDVLEAFGATAKRLGAGAATFVRAVSWAAEPVTTIVVVGEGDAGSDELFSAARKTYRPRSVLRRFAAGQLRTDLLPPELQVMVTGESPRAYVCVGNTCRQPVETVSDLLAALAE